ncbi:DNA-binding transcriptional regulator, partial [Pseudomonas sp. FW300-E2]|uniref:helix-turn-helix domain-containing protein n=1 Tax=Pseudomonas sp. FW300-E2 TaxID=2070650 RepID=UPI001C495321
GWTQAEMAFALGVASRLTVSQWETGASIPGGPSMRLLSLLGSLPDPELQKTAKRLTQIAENETAKAPR